MGSKNGNRKHGRNKVSCARYALEGRQDKNKALSLSRVLKRAPWDKSARAAFDRLPVTARKSVELPPYAESPRQAAIVGAG